MESVGTEEGQVGYFWQGANYFWQFAKCCRTTGGFHQNDLGVLARYQCGWQWAKFGIRPKPKVCAIARREAYVSMYIAYISVSKSTPWAVAGPHGHLASAIS